jgi:TRAP-type mannitol/chloroaromatic compound transport system substrate-binding protein
MAGVPPIPARFQGDVLDAVAAGRSGGGLDAAYVSGGELSRTWGFLYNSGIPFGPAFEEYLGFLYGRIDPSGRTGLDLAQDALDQRGRGVVAVPIVGSPEQMSGYFPEPMDDVGGRRGIGLAGLCQRPWTLRYLPPGEAVLGQACDDLLAEGKIQKKSLTFVESIPGGGSLIDAAAAGRIQGFEFATPLDDQSQLFSGPVNPGTIGMRYVHAPGWQQQFLITWMIVNRRTWDGLGAARQVLFRVAAQASVIASYAENMRQQGAALRAILGANRGSGNDVILSRWSTRDQARLQGAAIRVLNARTSDPALPAQDRQDYARMLEAMRSYVHAGSPYWDVRQVDPALRFGDWADPAGQCWRETCDPRRLSWPRKR